MVKCSTNTPGREWREKSKGNSLKHIIHHVTEEDNIWQVALRYNLSLIFFNMSEGTQCLGVYLHTHK